MADPFGTVVEFGATEAPNFGYEVVGGAWVVLVYVRGVKGLP